MSQRDGLLLLGRGYDDNNKKKSLRTQPYGLEGFLATGSAFPLENETMTKCMQWKDQIAYRCPLGLIPPGVMNCVCVCVCTLNITLDSMIIANSDPTWQGSFLVKQVCLQ